MKIFFLIFLVIHILNYFPCLYADDWDEIRKVAKNIKSVSAKFIQEKHMKILSKPFISKGLFHFTAPSSLDGNIHRL